MSEPNNALPCPFCGSVADLNQDDDEASATHLQWAVVCSEVGCNANHSWYVHARKCDAIKAWNTRALASSEPGEAVHVAITNEKNGAGKVVGLEWNPSYPVHAMKPGTKLYAHPPTAATRPFCEEIGKDGKPTGYFLHGEKYQAAQLAELAAGLSKLKAFFGYHTDNWTVLDRAAAILTATTAATPDVVVIDGKPYDADTVRTALLGLAVDLIADDTPAEALRELTKEQERLGLYATQPEQDWQCGCGDWNATKESCEVCQLSSRDVPRAGGGGAEYVWFFIVGSDGSLNEKADSRESAERLLKEWNDNPAPNTTYRVAAFRITEMHETAQRTEGVGHE